jgi:DNA polymerase-3 subunit delta
MEEALGKIVDALIPAQDRDLNLFIMDDESGGVDSVCEALLTPPLIPGPKVVLLPKTHLFYSKTSLPELVRKIADSAESDLAAAARAFMIFLDLAGWSLEQLRDDGWRRITDEQWQAAAGGEGGEEREKWLPRVLEYCAGQGMMAGRHRAGGTEVLEELLASGLPEGHCLVATADSVDRRKRLFKVATEKGVALSFIRPGRGPTAQPHDGQSPREALPEREDAQPRSLGRPGEKNGISPAGFRRSPRSADYLHGGPDGHRTRRRGDGHRPYP